MHLIIQQMKKILSIEPHLRHQTRATHLAILITPFLLFFLTLPAAAAEPADPAYLNDDNILVISITPNKREEILQETPAAVTAISEKTMEESHIVETRDIDGHVPNFRFFSFGNRGGVGVMNMRGLFNQNQADTAVTLYVDDAPYADVHAFDHPLYDVERIEVLRGPQGALFGKNTEGGVVNIITRKPGNVWEGGVNTEVTSDAGFAVRPSLSGPLVTDKLFIGLSGVIDSSQGWIGNAYDGGAIGGRDTKSGLAKIRWTPTNDWDIQFTVSDDSYRDIGGFFMLPVDRDEYASQWLPQFYGMAGLTAPTVKLGNFEVFQNVQGRSNSDTNRETLRLAYAAPGFDVLSISTRRAQTTAFSMDSDLTPLDMQTYNVDYSLAAYTQEFRVMSREGATPFKWLAGAYFEKKDESFFERYPCGTVYPSVLAGLIPVGSQNVTADARFTDFTWAIFGNAGYRLFDERLGLTAGLRYEQAAKTMDRAHYFLLGGLPVPLNVGSQLVLDAPSDFTGLGCGTAVFNEWLPRFAIDWRITPQHMAYVSAAKGYKPGGFDYRADDPAFFTFKAETCWTYETGLKTEWLDKRLMVNVAGFYNDVTNYQDIVAYSPYQLAYHNAGGADIIGFEAEARFKPIKSLEITGLAGILDGRYRNYRDATTGQNYSGKFLVLTPPYNYGLTAQYRFDMGLTLRGEVQGYGKTYINQTNTRELAPYTLLHSRVSYPWKDFEIYAFGKNLADTQYYAMAADNFGIVGERRLLGLGITWKF
jgi:iron complex outermembrane receptor protein